MVLTGLADKGKHLQDERCTVKWFITSVCGGGGTEELQTHAYLLNHYHASVTVGFRHASVGWWVDTSIQRHRPEAGHAVINHLDVSIYL